MGSLRFGRLEVKTSNETKVFFPDDGITKGDLISHYVKVAERMLPHLKGRPLSFQRYPDGIEGVSFFQKDTPKHYPDWITSVPMEKKGGVNQHVVADRVASLAYLANNGVVTIHGASATVPDLTKPDRLIFDLDPSVDDFAVVKAGAKVVRSILEDDLSLPTFLQTTGSRGLHIVTPIKPELGYDEVAAFALRVAQIVVEHDPDSFTIERMKAKRGDRLLIDHFRNAYAQTAAVPYSVRPRPGAPVATPIEWAELGRLRAGAATFTVTTIDKRLKRGDPWADMKRRARSLRPAIKKLR